MKEVYVSQEILHKMMYEAIARSARIIPRDVKARLRESLQEEPNELARAHLEMTLKNFELGEQREAVACADTGSPLFYIKIGDNVRIEGGFSSPYEVGELAVAAATKAGQLRENMVHPLTRRFTGNNAGLSMPKVEIRFDPNIDYLEVVGVSQGGAAEIFGTFVRMVLGGHRSAMKFILDSIKEATYAGKTCAPGIIGVGLGGTADLCVSIAKEAAVLRLVGDRHPDPEVAKMELALINFVKALGRGPMGTGGVAGVLDVHIECAACHAANLPVAIQMQCCPVRRAVTRYGPKGNIEYDDVPTLWRYR